MMKLLTLIACILCVHQSDAVAQDAHTQTSAQQLVDQIMELNRLKELPSELTR